MLLKTPARFFPAVLALTLFAIVGVTSAAAQAEKILYRFGSVTNDGAFPTGTLIADKQGNLYGTTGVGGGQLNQGTVFELTLAAGAWTEEILYTFTGNADGGVPSGPLVFDNTGNLYGTTYYGGANSGNYGIGGVVFELSPPAIKGQPWKETVLFDFSVYGVGWTPVGGVSFDLKGNLYGVNAEGGGGQAMWCGDQGCGMVYQLQPPAVSGGSWTVTDVHDFFRGPGEDGFAPNSLVVGPGGVLYGTTLAGQKPAGGGSYGLLPGVVFRLNPPTTSGGSWTERILYTFLPGTEAAGAMPNGVTLVNGHLFGTTQVGGAFNHGVVFELSLPVVLGQQTETVLYSFTGGDDGAAPRGRVITDPAGNLYGTALQGGSTACTKGCGTVFKLSPSGGGNWTETTLYDFAGGTDGYAPNGTLLMRGGTLFGATDLGGVLVSLGAGTVFQINP